MSKSARNTIIVLALVAATVALVVAIPLLQRPEPRPCKPLVVFYSGFGSQSKANLLWELCQNYSLPGATKRCLPHSNSETDFILAHRNSTPADTPIVLIGHSWGGETAYRVAQSLSDRMAPTLITLDPVSGRPWDTYGIPFLAAVALRRNDLAKPTRGVWLNIHKPAATIDLDVVTEQLFKFSCDGIADIGGLWGDQVNALSIEFDGGHCDIDDLFDAARPTIASATQCLAR